MKVKRKDCSLSRTPYIYSSLLYKLNTYTYEISQGYYRIEDQLKTLHTVYLYNHNMFQKSTYIDSDNFGKWFTKKEQRIFKDMIEIYDSVLISDAFKK